MFGTVFTYNESGEISGIQFLMSDKNKISGIKNINVIEGRLPNDTSDVIYIGDGLTDMYAMEFVKNNGGISIYVYEDEMAPEIQVLKDKKIVTYFVKRDFTLNGDLFKLLLSLINCKTI